MEKQKIKSIKKLEKIVNNSKIKCLIFDFDGVITYLPIDYDSLRIKMSEYFQCKYNFKNSFNPLNPNLKLVKKRLGKQVIREAYRIIEKHEIECLPKTLINKEIANFIKKNKPPKKIVIFSMNMRKTIKNFLIKNKLLKYIDLIIAKDNVDQYKPNPEGLYKILDKLNLNKNEVIFIGDKKIDLQAGKAAEIKVVVIS